MVPRRGSVLAAMAAGFALAAAILIPPPAKAGGSASVEPLTPAGAKLFPADAALQQVWRDQLGFFEGPAWDRRAGQFVFSDIPGNRLYRWNGRGAPQAWLSGIQTSHDGAILDPERNRYMVGPNGSVVTDDGGLIFAFSVVIGSSARTSSQESERRLQRRLTADQNLLARTTSCSPPTAGCSSRPTKACSGWLLGMLSSSRVASTRTASPSPQIISVSI